MFAAIKTSKENKVRVSELTNRLNLGAENVIARLALSCSLATNRKLNLLEIEDAQGKEYSIKVLFGDYADIYIAMISTHYGLYKADKDIAKYIKMHIDDGLRIISNETRKNPNLTGTDFLISRIERGLKAVNNHARVEKIATP